MTTTEKKTYNGWTNRETWLVGVHDFFDYDEIKEVLKDTIDDKRYGYEVIANNPELGGLERALTLYLADWLEQSHEDTLYAEGYQDDPYKTFNVQSLNPYLMDHLNGSIERINWLEIAGHYDEEIKEVLGVTA